MFTIILVESSLELIPAELSKHQSVLAYSKKFKKNVSKIFYKANMELLSQKIRMNSKNKTSGSIKSANYYN